MKHKVLICGEHPNSHSGNAHMLNATLNQIDYDKYEVVVFAANEADPINIDFFQTQKYKLITSTRFDAGIGIDNFGLSSLSRVLATQNFDILLMVGIDLWQYAPVIHEIARLCKTRKIKWSAIFPYDSPYKREEWIYWMNLVDFPCVYSKFGYNLLKNDVENLRYYRPPLYDNELYTVLESKDKVLYRGKYFAATDPKDFIFGFIGPNQFRKEPQKILKAYAQIKNKTDLHPCLYLHTELKGVFNLEQYAKELNMCTGDILAKQPGSKHSTQDMVGIYNTLNAYINCAMQEGLSWTVLEAMLCGTPCILSDTTAHKELIEGGCAYPVPCEQETFVPIQTTNGPSFIEAKGCKVEDISKAMFEVMNSHKLRTDLITCGMNKVKEWLAGVSDINNLFEDITTTKIVVEDKRQERVLFCQHSAAGDVFMTTRCLKGIKERYNLPIDYMTQPKYMGVVCNNPYLDKLIPWDESEFANYKYVINVHGEKILPGHWGRNSNALLSDFYWKLLRVEPNDFFIEKVKPQNFEVSKETPICIVHTTGGDPQFRTYKYMADVCKALQGHFITIQVGGVDDFPAKADIDMRGKLTYGETAYIISKAKIAVTVDSFISHLTGALGVSQVCLFGSGNHNVVRPNQMKGTLICRVPDYINNCVGLGPCSASKRDCASPCTSMHDPKDIVGDLSEIIRRKYKKGLLVITSTYGGK